MARPETPSPIALSAEALSLTGESVVSALSPWECLERARVPNEPLFLWEAPHGEALAGIGAVRTVEADGPERFEEVRAGLARLLGRAKRRGPDFPGFPGAIAIGGFAFEEQGARRGWPGFADASFTIPSRVFWKSRDSATLETRWSAEEDRASREEPWTLDSASTWDRAAWLDRVRVTIDRIREGAFSKAVLARSVGVALDPGADAAAIMASLRAAYPACYRFLIDDGRGRAFLGASPERLVRLVGGEVRTEAVAGTLRCEPSEDGTALGYALAESEKDRSEHEIVVRHLLEALGPLCDALAPGPVDVMRLPHLLHLRTPVRGMAREGAHVLDLVARLHPTPAVAGWPRGEALDWIRRAEGGVRGWYAGPVGWVNAAGEGDFAVGIRSVAIRGPHARLFAGAGIVEGSDPALEWSETELKMKGILDAVARD